MTTRAAWKTLEDDGFAVIKGVSFSTLVDDLVAGLRASPIHRSRGGARNGLRHPAVHAVAHDPRLVELVAELLGATPLPFSARFFDKSESSNWLVAWHQDTMLPLRQRRHVAGWGPRSTKAGVHYARATADVLSRVVSVRLHLDDSTRANGPLRVLPGTHALGVLEAGEVQRLASARPSVECLASKGTVLVMKPLLVHASSKSAVPVSRRVLHIEYARSFELGDGLELAVA